MFNKYTCVSCGNIETKKNDSKCSCGGVMKLVFGGGLDTESVYRANHEINLEELIEKTIDTDQGKKYFNS